LVQALLAFDEGAYPQAVSRLREVRPKAHRFGGSHAQRDIIDLTLLAAAQRAGEAALVKALTAERRARGRQVITVRAGV
jgi:hypothetical protein